MIIWLWALCQRVTVNGCKSKSSLLNLNLIFNDEMQCVMCKKVLDYNAIELQWNILLQGALQHCLHQYFRETNINSLNAYTRLTKVLSLFKTFAEWFGHYCIYNLSFEISVARKELPKAHWVVTQTFRVRNVSNIICSPVSFLILIL